MPRSQRGKAVDIADAAVVRRIIDRKNREICRAYADGDADRVAAIFSEQCSQMPPNAPPLVGREAVRRFWAEATRWGRWNFEIEAREVLLEGDVAAERGAYTLRLEAGPEAPPGFEAQQDSGNYLVVWRREGDGEWRAFWDAAVSDRPSAPKS